MITFELVMKIIFWGSALLVAYTYFGYPLLIAAWARFKKQPIQRRPLSLPVTIIISAYNEEQHIEAKLDSCFQQDYAQDLIQVIVVSDGSTDATEAIVNNYKRGDYQLKLITLKDHVGKAQALNSAVVASTGAILIFTDARQLLSKGAVSSLVANFADAKVGACSGELLFVDEDHRPNMSGVGLYWRFEKWLRETEASIHSMCGATGALYAIRRELFEFIPPGLVLDDVLIPMRAPLAGYRIVFDGNAQVYDHIAVSNEAEFTRKVRTLYGNYQLLSVEPRICIPKFNPIFFQFFSHKICRLLAPFGLIAMFIANLFLWSGIYPTLMVLQISWYLLALAGFMLNEHTDHEHSKRDLITDAKGVQE